MKNFALIAVLLSAVFLSTPAISAEANTISVSVEKAKEYCDKGLAEFCQKTPADAVKETVEVVRDNSHWAKEVAYAIGIAARELGVAANEFLNSPAGIMTAVVLVWKFIGAELVSLAISFLIGVPLVLIVTYTYLRFMRSIWYGDVEYENVPLFWGLVTYRKLKKMEKITNWGEGEGGLTLLATVAYFIGMALIVGLVIL